MDLGRSPGEAARTEDARGGEGAQLLQGVGGRGGGGRGRPGLHPRHVLGAPVLSYWKMDPFQTLDTRPVMPLGFYRLLNHEILEFYRKNYRTNLSITEP